MPKDPFKTLLEIAKNKISKKNLYKDKEPPSSIGTAFKLSAELVSAVVVGTIIGFILDKTFGTKPWLILIFFFVGVIAGIMNVVKSAKNKLSRKSLYKNKQSPSSIGTAFKMSTELVSAVVVGTIIGFILDKTFGTKPWLILIFFFVGVVAGILNVFKSAKKMQR